MDWEDPLEKGRTTHSSILAWRIPWTEEPGGLQSMGLQSQTGLSNQHTIRVSRASQMALVGKNLPDNAGGQTRVQSLGWEEPVEEGMAVHSSVLA